jgi:hypothetical protein
VVARCSRDDKTPTVDVATVADELYGLDPGEFTATRDRRASEARRAGDRETAAALKALRRPSSAAWAVNVLARERPEEVRRLTELGAALREAQEQLAAEDLRALSRQRHRVVAGLVAEARTLAGARGVSLSDSVAREVESTLDAALADPAAGEAVRTGRLVRTLERSGFGEVVGDVAPGGATPPPPAEDDEVARRRALEVRRREAERLETAAREAEATLADAVRGDEEAQQASDHAAAEVDRLTAALDQARRTAGDAAARAGRTAQKRRDAEQDAVAARRAAEDASAQAGVG